MVRTRLRPLPVGTNRNNVRRVAEAPLEAARLAAHFGFDERAVAGHIEPCRGGQQVEEVEEDRAGGTCPDDPRPPLARGIAHPHAHGVARRNSHGPRVAETVARARLPCHGLHGGDRAPVDVLRPIHLLDGLKREPDAARSEDVGGSGATLLLIGSQGKGDARLSLEATRHVDVGRGDVPQGGFGATEDERKAVVRGRSAEGGESSAFQEVVELGDAIAAEQHDGGHVERAGDDLCGGHGPLELQTEVLRRKAIHVDRNVGQEGAGKDVAILHGGTVEQGFEDAARAAWRTDDVDLTAWLSLVEAGIATVGQHAGGTNVDDDRGHVSDVLLRKLRVPPCQYGFDLRLHALIDRRNDAFSGARLLKVGHQM